jgi:hypothetical protein
VRTLPSLSTDCAEQSWGKRNIRHTIVGLVDGIGCPRVHTLRSANGRRHRRQRKKPRRRGGRVEGDDGGADGVLVTAVSVPTFAQALQMVRRKGTVSLVGLPPGEFPTPIFDVVRKRITLRGSIVGTRKDLTEALAFAAEGKVRAHSRCAPVEDVNSVFQALKAGAVDGRIVLDMRLASQVAHVVENHRRRVTRTGPVIQA